MAEKNNNDKDSEQPTKWQLWAKGKKPSMKRRCEQNDYTQRRIYMITISIEGRRPLLGNLKGNVLATDGNDKPRVILTAWGERVRKCWLDIPKFHPEIKVIRLGIMPDHIHGVLFVQEKMAQHLGYVINGFKAGTHKAARELGLIATTMPQDDGQQGEKKGHYDRNKGLIWEPNYHDRLLKEEGQLQRMIDYIEDNPRRLLLKRAYPQFLSNITSMTVTGISMQALGNTTLIHQPKKIQLQCSRHLYPNEIEQRKAQILKERTTGAVIVSPCISPGEAIISKACLETGIRLIVLLLKGFPPFFKPKPRYLEACAKGQLLLLAPYPWQNEKIENMRARCLQLNNIAQEICKNSE